jgi:hypothetical protein
VSAKREEQQGAGEDAPDSIEETLDDLPDEPTITVYGDFIDHVGIIQTSLMSLLLGVGRLKDDANVSVLIPYIEMKLSGAEPEEGIDSGPLFSQILTLDNAAYVIADLLGDFRLVCENLRSLSKGELRPEPARIERTRQFILAAQSQLNDCLAELDVAVERLRDGQETKR